MFKGAVETAIDSEIRQAERAGRCIAALTLLKDVPGLAYASASASWIDDGTTVYVGVSNGAEPRESVKAIMRAIGAKRADKKFNEVSGKVEYQIKTAMVSVEVTAGAPTNCEVEMVEDDVVIPAAPERVEKRKVYRLKDAKCLEGRSVPEPEPPADEPPNAWHKPPADETPSTEVPA